MLGLPQLAALASEDPGRAEPPEVWQLPATAANGLVVLNHGFARRCSNLRALADAMTAAGWAVVCRNRDAAPERPSAWLAQLRSNQLNPPGLVAVPERWVVAGHSAGGAEAARLARLTAELAPGYLAGLILLDPVARDNTRFAQDLVAAGVPILAILATPGRCNAQARSERAVRDAAAMSPGVRVVGPAPGSTHLDAEGQSTEALAVAACAEGRPQSAQVAALLAEVQLFLTAWGKAR